MRKRTTAELKRRSGADLRAQRDQKLSRPYELQEAGRREASFLKNIATAGDDLEWILGNRAWKQLGFDRAGDWWDARIRPAFDLLDVRPSHALIERALSAITEDEQELPAAQRRTQRELAALMKVSPSSISRSRPVADATQDDLDKDSGGVGGEDADVSGQEPPADIPTSQVALVAGQPGSYSPVAPGEAPSRNGVQPPAHGPVGEEPVPFSPVAAEETATSSAAPNLTEEQAPTSPVEPVLSLSGAGVSLDGDEVEEESETSTEDSSSTDPTFIDAVDALWVALDRLDYDVTGPLLLDEEMSRIEKLGPAITDAWNLLKRWRE